MQQIQADPLWDEGISSFLLGEYEKQQAALTIDALQLLANEHAIRIGDLLETLFLMSIYGEWKYTDTEGNEEKLDEKALDDLYAKGRLSPEDLTAFEGVWSPNQ